MSRERFEDGQLVSLDEHMRGHDASEPFPAIFKEDGDEDDYLLSPEEFDLLTAQEKDDYLTLLGVQLGKTWNLERSPKQMLANALANKVDYLYYGGAAGGGKALDLKEPIPTPSGWTLNGDLRVGDEVFGRDGKPTTVIGLHPVEIPETAFLVTFDDGSTIEASGEHRWLTFTASELSSMTRRSEEFRARRRANRPSRATGNRGELVTTLVSARNTARSQAHQTVLPGGAVRTTSEIAATLRLKSGRANHAVPMSPGVELPDADLPIDPYLLGVWLGDGTSAGGTITSDTSDMAHTRGQFDAAGYVTTDRSTEKTFGVSGLLAQLKSLGLVKNKHIPPMYLRASRAQRLALLQGLMDTDGSVGASGSVEFSSSYPALADGVFELILSLGHKVTRRAKQARLNGVDKRIAHIFLWTPPDPVFRMPRKLERLKLGAQRRTNQFRYIVGCEPITPKPMRCITVAAEDGLFLAGERFIVTHNSEMACYHAHDLSMRYPGHVSLVLRTTLPELRRSLIRRMQQRLIELGMAREVKLRKVDNLTALYYSNGSIVEYGYCSNDEQVTQYLSAEYDLLVMDEASRFTPYAINMISSRVRTTMSKRAKGIYPHTLWLSNPGGKAHLYLRKFAYDSTQGGQYIAVFDSNNGISPEDFMNGIAQPVRMIPMPADHTEVDELEIEFDPENEITVAFVSAKVADNPYIDSGYVRRLRGLSEVQRRQFLEGDMRVAEGTAFPEFDPAIHVIEPFDIPESWQRACGIDYGYAKPACCVWGAWSPEGDFYIYRESKLVEHHPTEQAKNWVLRSRYPSRDGVEGGPEVHSFRNADPSAHRTTGARGVTVAMQWKAGGWHTRMAPNSRVAGWSNLHAYLAMRQDLPPDEPPRPHLRVFSDCRYVIEQLSEVPISLSDPEDVDTTADDHGADAIRYLLQGRPIRAVKRKAAEQLPGSHLEARLQDHIEKLRRRGRRR